MSIPVADPFDQPIAGMATGDLEALLRIRTGQARIWGDMAAHPDRYESPSKREAPAQARHYRRLIVEITSELDRRRGTHSKVAA